MLGRYFYFESNGSTKNVDNHITEIQIIDKDGVNRALGRGVFDYSGTSYADHLLVTDGITTTDPYYILYNGRQYLIIDIGAVYDIAYIKIWRYYGDSRAYHDVFIKVSKDNISYKTVFSSEKDGEYVETSAGKTIDITNVKYDERYLIRSNSILYTITNNNSLSELAETELNANVFITYGVDTILDSSVLLSLDDPEVLCWKQEGDLPSIQFIQTAIPKSQTIISNEIDLTHSSITGIESARVNCEGNIVFAVSFDDKQTWKVWNGTEWSIVLDEFSGMTKELFESITYDQWMPLHTGASSFYIRASLLDNTSKLTEIYIDFAN